MTREEAVQVLQEKIDDRPLFKDEREAFEIAIEALSEVRCNDCKWNDDVIEVVRCKDCRHSVVKDETIHGRWCERFALHDMAVGDMGYCSFGELAEQTNYKMPGYDDIMEKLDELTLKGGGHE